MDEYDLERLFHENSKAGNFTQGYRDDLPESWTTIEYKEYPRFDRTDVGVGDVDVDQPLGALFRERASPYQFTGDCITQRQLAGALLGSMENHTHREDGRPLRAYPSAGARYPLEIYLSVAHVKGIEQGIYHLNVSEETLEAIAGDQLNDVVAEQSGQSLPIDAAVIIALTAVPERTRRKYGIRGYRYLLFEAGHLMQNLLLGAQAMGFSGRPWGAFLEDEIDKRLGIDSEAEETIYLGIFGVPAD